MSPTGRPEGEEHRSAQHEGTPVHPTGCPEGEEHRSAQHEGTPVHPTGRPEGEGHRSAQHEATPVTGPAEALADDPLAATMAALRERGAPGFDAVRFRFIEALARRASAHEGDARRLLDGRLATLLAAFSERFEQAQAQAVISLEAVAARFPDSAGDLRRQHAAGDLPALRRLVARLEAPLAGNSPLAELVRHIARQSSPPPPAPQDGEAAEASPEPEAGRLSELKTMHRFRSTWSRLSVDQRMHRAQAKLPGNAGPLNSQVLALRALQLMREISPKYLDRFMSYLDALVWLERAEDAGLSAPKDTPGRGEGEAKRKAVRRKPG
jgi:hypothetical protein